MKCKYRIIMAGSSLVSLAIALLFGMFIENPERHGTHIAYAMKPEAPAVEHIDVPGPERTPTPEPVPLPTETPEPTPKPTPKPPWTTADVRILAKIVHVEAGSQPRQEQAAVIWCVLNRLDTGRYGRTIRAVALAPHQFAYRKNAPARPHLVALTEDVLERWWRERLGETDVGRTLPANYLYFAGRGGRNHFRTRYRGSKGYWNWSLPNPYE